MHITARERRGDLLTARGSFITELTELSGHRRQRRPPPAALFSQIGQLQRRKEKKK